ncbi:MAG TPA: hypothetical protein VLV15_00820, partial [Dongiaceae bacterium]|nr:hypothetical protein [Dongiaceae bacterium]
MPPSPPISHPISWSEPGAAARPARHPLDATITALERAGVRVALVLPDGDVLATARAPARARVVF